MKTKYLLSAVLLAAQLFCGSAFAAPAVSATASNALEVEPQGEVFVSPDFIWSEETPGEFQVRFTITNGSDTVIPETEVRITLPDAALQFDAEASFSGQAPPPVSIFISYMVLTVETASVEAEQNPAKSCSPLKKDAAFLIASMSSCR